MSVTPKDPDRRQRRHTGKAPTTDLVALPTRFELPEPPEELLPAIQQEWRDFWSSELGRMARSDTDGATLRRLFFYRDEWERNAQLTRHEDFDRFTKGSTGQIKLNPLFAEMQRLEAAILAIEDRFGLNPRQRLALGATVVDTQKSLEDLNRRSREQSNPEPRPAPVDLATDEG